MKPKVISIEDLNYDVTNGVIHSSDAEVSMI